MAAGACDMQQVLFVGCNRQPSFVTSCTSLLTEKDLDPGEILVKTICAAVCPSDLEKLDTKQVGQELPSAFGHEGVGEVILSKRQARIGEPQWEPGDRILFCAPQCLDHRDWEHSKTTSRRDSQPSTPDQPKPAPSGGTFSTHFILKRDAHIVRLPDGVPPPLGALVNCPFAKMTCALETLQLQTAPTWNGDATRVALIEGATVEGLYSCAVLHEKKYDHIIVLEKNQRQWKAIEQFGGTPTHSLSDDSHVDRVLRRHPLQLVIDFGNCPQFLASAMDLLCCGGIYLLARTSARDTVDIPADIVVQKSLLVRGIQSYAARHLQIAADFVSSTIDRYPYDSLVSKSFRFSQFTEAIEYASEERFQHVIIQPG